MTHIFARQALTADGWAENVRIAISSGRIESLRTDSHAESEDFVAGILIPGLANVHSHAFQRVLAGHTEQRGPADSMGSACSGLRGRARLAGLVDTIQR